jgi:hypothetical protein
MIRGVVVALASAGCVSYAPDGFARGAVRFDGKVRVVGCLEVSIDATAERAAGAAVVGYSIGNRCDRAVEVDLAAARVRGFTGEGRAIGLAAEDPAGELGVRTLEARSAAREVIAYTVPAGAALSAVCVDVGVVDGHRPAPRPIDACFSIGPSPGARAAPRAGPTAIGPRGSTDCVEVSPVLGRRRCGRFGAWDVSDRARVQLGVAASMHMLPLDGLGVGAEPGGAREEPALATARSIELRATGSLGRRLYAGGEGQIGHGRSITPGTIEIDGIRGVPEAGTYVAAGGVLGATVTTNRRWATRAELMAGVRFLRLEVRRDGSGDVDEERRAAWGGRVIFQPRLRIERWLSPWVTLGGMIGLDGDGGRGASLSVVLTGHTRAFDAAW